MHQIRIGHRIALARKQAQLTQSELAKAVGLQARTTVTGYEANRIEASVSTLEKIATSTGKPLAWFFLEDGYRLERDAERIDLAPIGRVRKKLAEAEAELQILEESLSR